MKFAGLYLSGSFLIGLLEIVDGFLLVCHGGHDQVFNQVFRFFETGWVLVSIGVYWAGAIFGLYFSIKKERQP